MDIRVAGRYRILKLIGGGAFGVVYQGNPFFNIQVTI